LLQLTAAEAFRAGSMMINPRLNASRASLRSANERLRRMSAAAIHSRQHSIAAGTEETILENGSLEHLQATAMSAGSANGRQPFLANGTSTR